MRPFAPDPCAPPTASPKFAQRRLSDDYPYLILDARYEKVREDGIIQSQAVLIAIGINWEGQRQVLGVDLANRESQSTWRDFLLALKQRGLSGVELAVSDDHAGLRKAIVEILPEAARQRCYVHFLRNCLDYLPRKADDDCLQELRWLYARRNLGPPPSSSGSSAHKLEHYSYALGSATHTWAVLHRSHRTTTVRPLWYEPGPHRIRRRPADPLDGVASSSIRLPRESLKVLPGQPAEPVGSKIGAAPAGHVATGDACGPLQIFPRYAINRLIRSCLLRRNHPVISR
jgi:hypothetical protein